MVDINPFYNLQNLEDQHSYQSLYNHLPGHPFQQEQDENQVRLVPRQPLKRFMLAFSSGILLLVSLVALLGDPKSNYQIRDGKSWHSSSLKNLFVSTGVKEGLSDKAVQLDGVSFPWTKAMLAWQRTAFHFQPTKNWMNDPDGPLFHMGWYHLFYQYNPDEAIWGNITWGHAVSKDLIHWLYLPLALEATAWYDSNGTWTGSATLLPNGNIVMIYTGSTNEGVQVQNVAFPANLSDPLLLDWVKYSGNPVIVPPPGIGLQDFRDPTTAWYVGDKWHVGIGSTIGLTGIAFVYETTDFLNYTLLDGVLHAVPTTGMWECIDFYPISTTSDIGLDTSFNGPDIKHLLKASLNDDKHDYYALGTYYAMNNSWIPDDPELDVGIGIRYDYGKFYASKTFYDQNTGRRLLWGWIGETDSQDDDIEKDWAGLQSIPRVVVFDMNTKSNILLWPIEEMESLRLDSKEFNNIEIEVGSVIPLDIGSATQLDITAEFEIASEGLEETIEADVLYNCSTSGGAAGRGVLGPFGLLVIADKTLSEQTAVYFYIAKAADGDYKTYFCTDGLRSSLAEDALKRVYGSYVPVLDGEKLTVRILVDHSIVEAFAQGGRTCITSRVYPTEAIYGAAGLFLFNNATGINVTLTSLTVWQMDSAFIHSYPL